NSTAIRRNAMACVALPTCGLALAESERYLPELVTKLEGLMVSHGLGQDEIVVRMTGCPNGCARPYIAEIGFVGKGPGRYNMYLGGSFAGERLGKLYGDNLDEAGILAALDPLFAAYAAERAPGERFGDFMIRTGRVVRTINGPDFHSQTGPQGIAAAA
ncbi:MAG TPA: sulfite reductase, partial [Enterovirga sp.]